MLRGFFFFDTICHLLYTKAVEKFFYGDDMEDKDVFFPEEENEKEKKKDRVKAEILDWAKALLFYCVLPVAVFELFCFTATVPTGSMEPTIPVGGKCIATRSWYDGTLEYGDIVVFDSDEYGKLLIKRCIGKPGDTIEFVDGDLYRNGEYVEEPYVSTYDGYDGVFTVPENCYFFCGDNRAGSHDARYWRNPYILKDKIMGKAKILFFPFNEITVLE